MRLQRRVARALQRSQGRWPHYRPCSCVSVLLGHQEPTEARLHRASGSLAPATSVPLSRQRVGCHKRGTTSPPGSSVPLEVGGLNSLSPTVPGDRELLACRMFVPTSWQGDFSPQALSPFHMCTILIAATCSAPQSPLRFSFAFAPVLWPSHSPTARCPVKVSLSSIHETPVGVCS